MQEFDSRHRMTQNSSRIHIIGPAGTLEVRNQHSQINWPMIHVRYGSTTRDLPEGSTGNLITGSLIIS